MTSESTSFLLELVPLGLLCIIGIVVIYIIVVIFFVDICSSLPYHNKIAIHLLDFITLHPYSIRDRLQEIIEKTAISSSRKTAPVNTVWNGNVTIYLHHM